jgi:hypothetical protein
MLGDQLLAMKNCPERQKRKNVKNIIRCTPFNCKFNTSVKQAVTLVNTFISFGLQQAVFLPTRQLSCLDNIFTNIREDKFSIEVFNPAPFSCLHEFLPTNNAERYNRKRNFPFTIL